MYYNLFTDMYSYIYDIYVYTCIYIYIYIYILAWNDLFWNTTKCVRNNETFTST